MGEGTLRCNNFKHMWKFIIVHIKIIKVMWKQNTFIKVIIKHTLIKKHSTLIYVLEILNLKNEFLNYYFHWIKYLTRKTHNSIYIEKLIIKIFSKSAPWYQCHHIILLLSLLFLKIYHMKMHWVHTHWFKIVLVHFLKV